MNMDRNATNLFAQALYYKATDLHFIPRPTSYVVRFRINDTLINFNEYSFEWGERLISHLKFLASMDISEKRKPQSGSMQMTISNRNVSMRISTLPTIYAYESLAIRILPLQERISCEELSIFSRSTKILLSQLKQAHGLILLTGPTGSGKSTTLYSLADYCAGQLNRHVISIEDPVEIKYSSFLQMQVNEKAGITYQTGLKALLRHDPDVILIGEIRDAETALVAVRAALTGHLVLTSLHSRNAEGAIFRLIELGVNLKDLEQTLLAVTAQRLVRRVCPFCGDHCSQYCMREDEEKRTALLEILSGSSLQTILANPQRSRESEHYEKLPHLIRKGVALGYVPKTEYERWIIHEH